MHGIIAHKKNEDNINLKNSKKYIDANVKKCYIIRGFTQKEKLLQIISKKVKKSVDFKKCI